MARRLAPLFACLVGIAAFCLGCFAIRSLAPMQVDEVDSKLAFFRAHKDEFDTVFIGSSRVYHGVIPKVFDQASAAAGHPTRSFNFGIDGMKPPESVMMARRVVNMHPARLRRVFLEVANLGSISEEKVTPRDVYWHNLDALAFAWDELQSRPPGWAAWDEWLLHLRLFLRNQTSLGRGPEVWQEVSRQPGGRNPEPTPGPDFDGYAGATLPMTEEARLKLRDSLEQMRVGRTQKQAADPVIQGTLRNLRESLAREGLTLVFFTTPTTRVYNGQLDAPPGATLLAFDDPAAYPDLYRADHRFDFEHLNPLGADEFTRLLAQRAADLR